MKQFEKPVLIIQPFALEDILSTSTLDGDSCAEDCWNVNCLYNVSTSPCADD